MGAGSPYLPHRPRIFFRVEKTPKTIMAAAKKVHLDGDVGARASVEMVQGA